MGDVFSELKLKKIVIKTGFLERNQRDVFLRGHIMLIQT